MKKHIKNILFFLGLFLFHWVQSGAQIHFGLSIQEGLTEIKGEFWLWLVVFMILSLLGKPTIIWGYLEARTSEHIYFRDWLQAIKEHMRVMGSLLTWGLFFIIPGFIRYVGLFWTLWIVYLDPRYKLGQIDALQEAYQRFKKSKVKTISLIIIFDLLIALMIEGLVGVDSYSSSLFIDTMIYAFFNSGVTVVLLTICYKYFKKISFS